ncbi:hypothetical protein ACJX0J_028882, partial [Zea mays]
LSAQLQSGSQDHVPCEQALGVCADQVSWLSNPFLLKVPVRSKQSNTFALYFKNLKIIKILFFKIIQIYFTLYLEEVYEVYTSFKLTYFVDLLHILYLPLHLLIHNKGQHEQLIT